jgi:predicted AAA+ superfamily ATPase
MIDRTLQDRIEKRLFKGKAILVFGSRQCGKSTLIEHMLEKGMRNGFTSTEMKLM